MTSRPTTLISGAAKRIGAAIAQHLAAHGHNLVLHYNQSQAEAEALASELRSLPSEPEVTLVRADLEKPESVSSLWEGLPPVTTIIHNASRYTRDRLTDFTPADLRAHLAVNFESPLILSQGFVSQLPQSVHGNLIVLGDDALGWSASPEFFTYSVSKHSWRAIIDLMAAASAPRISANVIALAPTLPGVQDPEGMFDRLAAHAPLKRTGTVAEVLAAVDFLLATPGITGQTLGLGNGMGLSTVRP
jgi:NAD(P)-dependent dehydrogenase (short-subunit alcohol dehydrogenase family)